MEALAIRPPKKMAVVEEQRRQIAQLCLVERAPHAEVAKQLGIPIRAVRSHVQAIRRQVSNELVADPTAQDILTDTLTSIDVRIRAMNKQINELEARKDTIIDGLMYDGDDDDDGFRPIVAMQSKATTAYVELLRRLRKELREEEAHKAEILKKFGVLREQVDIRKQVVTRDDTAWVEATAAQINQGSADDRSEFADWINRRLRTLDQQS